MGSSWAQHDWVVTRKVFIGKRYGSKGEYAAYLGQITFDRRKPPFRYRCMTVPDGVYVYPWRPR